MNSTINLIQFAETIQEMVQNGASVSDLVQILEPYYKAREKEIEQQWKDTPDRMGGQYTNSELDKSTWI